MPPPPLLNVLPHQSARWWHCRAPVAQRCKLSRGGASFALGRASPSEYVRRFRYTMPWELGVRWCACGDCARLEELADVGPSSLRDTSSCFSYFCCSVPRGVFICWPFRSSYQRNFLLLLFLSFFVKVRGIVLELGWGGACGEFCFLLTAGNLSFFFFFLVPVARSTHDVSGQCRLLCDRCEGCLWICAVVFCSTRPGMAEGVRAAGLGNS